MSLQIQEKISLKPYNSWRVGGEADYFCLPTQIEELKEALDWAKEKNQKVQILGGGSNVLISDRGVRGLVIGMKKFAGIQDESTEQDAIFVCKAGTLKQKVMRRFLKWDLPPALFLSGLPGDVAGGVVMNAGVSESVHPKEFVSLVKSFKVLKEGEEVEFQNKDVDWVYRKTQGWQPGVITEVTLSWPKSDTQENMKALVKQAQELRSSKQPLNLPSCGSVFRNPTEDKANNPEALSAGYFIEKAGMKGYQYGGAEVSRKHANFIVNQGAAEAVDFHCAISIVQKKVKHLFNIDLHTEVKYIGDWEGIKNDSHTSGRP